MSANKSAMGALESTPAPKPLEGPLIVAIQARFAELVAAIKAPGPVIPRSLVLALLDYPGLEELGPLLFKLHDETGDQKTVSLDEFTHVVASALPHGVCGACVGRVWSQPSPAGCPACLTGVCFP